MKKIALVLIATALTTCSGKPPAAPASAQKVAPKQAAPVKLESVLQQLPPGHPAIQQTATANPAQQTAPAAQGEVTGRVVETVDGGGYTYLRIATSSGDVWAAVGGANVKKGATVTVSKQMVAENFESKALHRKFDRLILGTLVDRAPATKDEGTAAQHMASVADVGDVKVEKAAGGKTVAEVWSQKNELKGQPIVIRGKVVKFLAGIMGKNWLHLRDGSGVHANGTDDIAVTTQDFVKVGDVVTVRGTLSVDKDFGAGYLYPVIVEDAKTGK